MVGVIAHSLVLIDMSGERSDAAKTSFSVVPLELCRVRDIETVRDFFDGIWLLTYDVNIRSSDTDTACPPAFPPDRVTLVVYY